MMFYKGDALRWAARVVIGHDPCTDSGVASQVFGVTGGSTVPPKYKIIKSLE